MLEQAKHIFDTFEYFWVDHKSNLFCNCLATRWRHHHFCWKLEFWAEFLFVSSLRKKITSRIDPKYPKGNCFPKRIHQEEFQLKISIFSKSDDGTTWWPNSYKKILTCGQLRNIQRYQKYAWLVRPIFFRVTHMFEPTVFRNLNISYV